MIQIDKMPPPPPQPGNHQACNTPNPPWWCDETPQTVIDNGLWLLVIIALLIGIIFYINQRKK